MNFTKTENKIIKAVSSYAASLCPPVIPRIAGGWVRDKLMGLKSDDMDIAIDRVSGVEFATGLVNSLPGYTPNVHKILANPEKSKHLETAVVRLFGLDVDFVHLRSETYSESRIPTIVAGTPESDAFRRDITINSLFYNIAEGKIEDFTGRGISDIKLRIIDTPLDPKITLMDDPLRILRIFRFRAKFGFQIHPRIREAIEDDKMRMALTKKISNERIRTEIFKMLNYSKGLDGLLDIVKSGYVNPIFNPGEVKEYSYFDNSKDNILGFNNSKHTNSKCISFESINSKDNNSNNKSFDQKIFRVKNFIDKLKSSQYKFDRQIISLYAILSAFVGIKVLIKGKEVYLNCRILQESLRVPKMQVLKCNKIESNIEILTKWVSDCPLRCKRDNIALAIDLGPEWLESLLICEFNTNNKIFGKIIQYFFENKLSKVHSLKNIVSGNDIRDLVKKPSEMQSALKKLMIIQVENPKLEKNDLIKIFKEENIDFFGI